MVPEPWTATSAMEYIKFVHLDKWWPIELREKHCAARAVTYTHIKDLDVKWRFLEILRAISILERWPKNNIPKSIATLMYVEYATLMYVEESRLVNATQTIFWW